jgi:ABC-type uncharacterized transport system ATPase subunit
MEGDESGGSAARRRCHSAAWTVAANTVEYVESLSVQTCQRFEIVKALAPDARTLLLDELTAVLTPCEVDGRIGSPARLRGAMGSSS